MLRRGRLRGAILSMWSRCWHSRMISTTLVGMGTWSIKVWTVAGLSQLGAMVCLMMCRYVVNHIVVCAYYPGVLETAKGGGC